MTIFDQIASNDMLGKAWKFLYSRARPKSRNTVGLDGISINDFALDPKAHLLQLSRELRRREFRFQPLAPFLIPKSSGKFRLICVPTVRDRIVQRALLDFLSDKYHQLLANSISYGFIKHRTVQEAAQKACTFRSKHPWVFKTDISSFFDRIDRSLLEARIRKTIREKSLHPLLIEALQAEVFARNSGVERRIARLGIKEGLGVRQGMPLSAFFANLILIPFDKVIEQKGLKAVRYADDLVFFGSSREECEQIKVFCVQQLATLNLEIPEFGDKSKSVIASPDGAIEFLGVEIKPINGAYELSLSGEQIDAIRTELMQLSSVPELLARGIRFDRIGTAIAAKTSGYLSAYSACTNLDELEHALDAIQQKILRTLYRDGLKIPVESLPNASKTFLGLRP